jgi:LysR family transcriptional regulator, glycine cleavage system transcriptional activator
LILPSIESLRCFVEAARLLNFRKAARKVALTPAAFGARIRQLEEQLGAPLFQRTTRVVTLTERGSALLPYAQRCLDAAEDCVRAARGDKGAPVTEIVLGTRHELGLSWLLPQLGELAEKLPHVELHLYFGSGPDLLIRVRTAEVDCAITSTRFSDPRLNAITLHRESYVFVGAPSLLKRLPLTKPEHAKHHVLLDASRDTPLYAYFRDAYEGKLEFLRLVRLGGIGAIRERVLAGAGIAVLPEYLTEEDLAKKRLVRIMPSVTPLADHFRLVFRGDDPRRSLYESLAEHLLETPLR